jgi:hypothetical protein
MRLRYEETALCRRAWRLMPGGIRFRLAFYEPGKAGCSDAGNRRSREQHHHRRLDDHRLKRAAHRRGPTGPSSATKGMIVFEKVFAWPVDVYWSWTMTPTAA